MSLNNPAVVIARNARDADGARQKPRWKRAVKASRADAAVQMIDTSITPRPTWVPSDRSFNSVKLKWADGTRML